jgi:DNA-binding winged helix-turn-helix (wHTH) protein
MGSGWTARVRRLTRLEREARAVRVRFGEFTFDDGARALSRGDCPVAVSPKVFDLLGALLAARPRALSRAELTDLLWPTTSVGYTSLASVATELRRVLGEDRHQPRFVRTVHGFGYAFCGTAEDVGSTLPVRSGWALVLLGREILLMQGENVIGRDEECSVQIDRPTISRRHARVLVQGDNAVVEDLGSKNGTLVNGRTAEGGVDLHEGDEVSLGQVSVTFRAFSGAVSTATAESPVEG